MGGVLQIDADGYVAASRTIGSVAATARSAADGLTSTLSGCAAMAGSDPAGVAWANEYDAAAESVLAATQDAVNAGYRLAALLEQTGFNYDLAESSSSGMRAGVDGTSYDAVPFQVTSPPRAAGPNAPSLPGGWSLVESAVGRVWPNGHQDRLRSAAVAWHSAACVLYDASHSVSDAVYAVAQQVAPEVDDAITVCNGVRDNLESLAGVYKALSNACDEYAAALDDAHSHAEHELISLLEWTAGIEGAGLFGALFTFGGSELAAQAAETTRIAATAARIAALLDRFSNLVRSAAESLTVLSARAAEIVARFQPLLATERAVAMTERAAPLQTGTSVATEAHDALAMNAAAGGMNGLSVLGQFRNRKLLMRHFRDHGADFGAATPADYASQAGRFFQRGLRDDLPHKVDGDGVIRIYDPKTNEFGVYASDGTIVTYFKPSSPTYWQRQPGS
jgi:hypothetical protein